MLAHVNGFVQRKAYMLVASTVAPKASSISTKASSSVAPSATIPIPIRYVRKLVSIVEPIAVVVGEVSVRITMWKTVSCRHDHHTEAPELIRPPDRAHLRDLSQSPAASSVTAALHLCVLTTQLCSTPAIGQSGETGAHTLIHTSGAICARDVASGTGAHVAAGRVGAFSSVTYTRDGATFVNIFTFVAGFTLAVSGWTFTLIGSNSIDAVTTSTKTWHCLALVHILAGSGADVGDETSPAGVWLGGALLTRVAPCSTNGGAAEGFGADNST